MFFSLLTNNLFHSTETSLHQVHNEISLNIDTGKVTALIHLGFSVAFDTTEYSILLDRLSNLYGISGTSLIWIRSFLTNRSASIKIRTYSLDDEVNMFTDRVMDSWKLTPRDVVDVIMIHQMLIYSNWPDTETLSRFEKNITIKYGRSNSINNSNNNNNNNNNINYYYHHYHHHHSLVEFN